MNNNVKTDTRLDFFAKTRANDGIKDSKRKNDLNRKQFLDEAAKNDVKIQIDDSVKDFSRMKKIVDSVPAIDNEDKVARLKREIQEGRYQIDYDALADKILGNEFLMVCYG